VRAGNSTTVAMSISGHKTDAVFRRYNITSTEDIKQAANKVAEYNSKRRNAVNNASSIQVAPKQCSPIRGKLRPLNALGP